MKLNYDENGIIKSGSSKGFLTHLKYFGLKNALKSLVDKDFRDIGDELINNGTAKNPVEVATKLVTDKTDLVKKGIKKLLLIITIPLIIFLVIIYKIKK